MIYKFGDISKLAEGGGGGRLAQRENLNPKRPDDDDLDKCVGQPDKVIVFYHVAHDHKFKHLNRYAKRVLSKTDNGYKCVVKR